MIHDVSANKLTAGTINGQVINVTNLNADNITAGTLNGQRIGTGSLSLDKLSEDVYTESEVDGIVDGLNARIDAQIETWTVDAVPTLNNSPASAWTTNDLKAEHVGDIVYVLNAGNDYDGYTYRFAYDNSTSQYKWVLIKDNQVTAALSRLQTAEGKIGNLESFESATSSWIEQTDEGLTTIRSNHTTLSGRVDKTVKSSVQLWYTKANTTAPAAPTSKVTSTATTGNGWRVVVPAYNSSYPNYYYCWQYEYADGTYGWSAVVRDIAMGESQSTSRTAASDASSAVSTANGAASDASTALSTANAANSTANSAASDASTALSTANSAASDASDAVSTANTASGNASTALSTANTAKSTADTAKSTADKNVKASVQLWFTKANTTAPSKPTAKVTTNNAATGNAWNLAVPTYNASYPNYYYCWQYELADGTYSWSDVVRDIATGEAQATARTAASNASSAVTTANTASSNASTALSTANTAKSTADGAAADASAAVTTANTAASDASSAVATANTANSTANTAKSTADTAKSTADTAKTTADTAKSTADSKARNFTSQPTPPYSVGDTWTAGSTGDVKVCTTARASGSYTASDWVLASKYTDDTKANAAQSTANSAVTAAATADGKAVTAQTTANANIKSSVMLWFSKANATAPSKPSAQVTSTATTGNAWSLVVPTWNASYPHYFYCYQQQRGDGTWQWTDVVYDRATSESQQKSAAALPSSTFTTFQSTTFKELVDEVDEQSSTITNMTESIQHGGVNLLKDSGEPSKWRLPPTNGYYFANIYLVENLTKGDKYTLQVWATVNRSDYDGSTIIAVYWGGGYVALGNMTPNDDRDHWTLTFTAPNNGHATTANAWLNLFMSPPAGASGTTYTCSVSKAKLERGPFATPWEYAQEDVTAVSNTVNSVKQTATSNSAKITSLETVNTNNGLTASTDITNRVSSVEQDLSGFKSTVSSTYATKVAMSAQQPFVLGTQTAATRFWTGSCPELSSLTDGQQITYWLPYGYANETAQSKGIAASELVPAETITSTYGNDWLKLTLADGTNTGWVPIYYGGTSRLTSHYAGSNAIHLTYREGYSSAIPRGWWADANYDSNTTHAKLLNTPKAGKNGIKSYTLCMRDDAGDWTSIVNQSSNGTSKTPCTYGLQLGNIAYYSSGTNNVAAGGNAADGLWETYTCDFRYSANITTSSLTARKPVYLVGTVGNDELFYLASSNWWTQAPSDASKSYILVGYAYSGYQIFLNANNPCYSLVDGKLVEYSMSRIVMAETAIEQNSEAITLKANAADTYTKTATDALLQVKANKATLTSEINASADTVKISADKVNIEGAAIFSSGRLSQSSLNNAYDSKGAASAAETNAKSYADTKKTEAINSAEALVTSTRNWYATCDTAAETAAKVATITPTTTDFTTSILTPGTTVYVKFTNTNTATVSSLTMNINGTGAKPLRTIRYDSISTIAAAGYLKDGVTLQLYYDGTNWLTNENYNADAYTARFTQYYNTIVAGEALVAQSIIGARENGKFYQVAGTGDYFNLSYPLLWLTTALNANATNYANIYTQVYDRNLATYYSSFTNTTKNCIVYLKGTVNGNNFTVYGANSAAYLTITEPTTEDGCVYIPLGRLGNSSNGKNYFNYQVSTPVTLFAFLDGKFRQVTPTDIVATQRIYYRCSASTITPDTAITKPSGWVTEAGDKRAANLTTAANWSLKKSAIAASVAAGETQYLYLYTCEQRKRLDGSIDYTTVVIDDGATVIDGGRIVTNSITATQIAANTITADQLDANSVKANIVQTTALSADMIMTGYLSADRIEAGSLAIGKVSGLETNLSNKDTAIANAAKRTDVAIAVTAISYSAGTATLQATLYVDGTATTSGVTYKWLRDGAVISGQTARTLGVTATMGLSHVYSCTATYS